jgi:hypothetical protein
MLIPRFLVVCGDVTNVHKILSRRLYLRGQIEYRFPFTVKKKGHVPFSRLNGRSMVLVGTRKEFSMA